MLRFAIRQGHDPAPFSAMRRHEDMTWDDVVAYAMRFPSFQVFVWLIAKNGTRGHRLHLWEKALRQHTWSEQQLLAIASAWPYPDQLLPQALLECAHPARVAVLAALLLSQTQSWRITLAQVEVQDLIACDPRHARAVLTHCHIGGDFTRGQLRLLKMQAVLALRPPPQYPDNYAVTVHRGQSLEFQLCCILDIPLATPFCMRSFNAGLPITVESEVIGLRTGKQFRNYLYSCRAKTHFCGLLLALLVGISDGYFVVRPSMDDQQARFLRITAALPYELQCQMVRWCAYDFWPTNPGAAKEIRANVPFSLRNLDIIWLENV